MHLFSSSNSPPKIYSKPFKGTIMTPSDITHAVAPFSKLRRRIPSLMLCILGIGTIASIDAFQTAVTTPTGHLSSFVGEPLELSGDFRNPNPEQPARIVIEFQPNNNHLTVAQITTSPALLTDETTWHATLNLANVNAQETLQAKVSFPDNPHQPSEEWTIHAYPDQASLEKDSRSLMLSYLSMDPIWTAMLCLLFSSLLAVLYPLLGYFDRRALATKGYLRVFHAKADGDDTLLYCVHPKDNITLKLDSYRVLSATGQLLGLAMLTEKGRRHCVFRLPTAQARAGCLIAIH